MSKVIQFPKAKSHDEIMAKVYEDARMFEAAWEMYWLLKQLQGLEGFRKLCSESVLEKLDGILAKAERKR